jgi:hypothetical protein
VRRCAIAVLAGLALGAGPAPALAAGPPSAAGEDAWVGRPLTEALLDLRSRGLKIVFTSEVVRPEMSVVAEPRAEEPRRILAELLAPHGLEARHGPGETIVVVPRVAAATREPAGEAPEAPPEEIALHLAEELVVTPSRLSLLRREPAAPLALSRDDILALPHLGDDPFRALSLLPGVTANDVSAEFHVRGGRRDETQILLDGQELYGTYHLHDYDDALSVVSPTSLESVDLATGGFSAARGDRMGGVLDMRTVSPTNGFRAHLGLSLLFAEIGGAGRFAAERGGWLLQARRGSTDVADRLISEEEPRYWDAFGKLDLRLGGRGSLRANALAASDQLVLDEVSADGQKHYRTDYGNAYLWLTHQTLLTESVFLETAAAGSRVDRDRRALELEEDAQFVIRDERELEVLELRQNWGAQPAPRHELSWGLALRSWDAAYDYLGDIHFDDVLAQIRGATEIQTFFRDRFEQEDLGAHLLDRVRAGEAVTAELGLRYDRTSATHESHLDPRVNVAWALGAGSVLRAAWGRFSQSQRPYELEVQDGETAFSPVERSEHRILGFEHLFSPEEAGSAALRVEVYHREVENPRPRYENLYEPINTFPEAEPDRVQVLADRALAEGAELFWRSRLGGRFGWWLNYAWASTDDVIDGERVPRQFDQTHTVNLDVDFRPNDRWSLNLAWRYHTGWPTTPLGVVAETDEEGEVTYVPVLGPAYSERLGDYHRLDLRASRRWRQGGRVVTLFFDVQNVYDRENPAGFDYDVDEETGTITPNPESWTGILPSVGVAVDF